MVEHFSNIIFSFYFDFEILTNIVRQLPKLATKHTCQQFSDGPSDISNYISNMAGEIKSLDKMMLDEGPRSPTILPWDRFSNWLHVSCVITFDLELGQAMEVDVWFQFGDFLGDLFLCDKRQNVNTVNCRGTDATNSVTCLVVLVELENVCVSWVGTGSFSSGR